MWRPANVGRKYYICVRFFVTSGTLLSHRPGFMRIILRVLPCLRIRYGANFLGISIFDDILYVILSPTRF